MSSILILLDLLTDFWWRTCPLIWFSEFLQDQFDCITSVVSTSLLLDCLRGSILVHSWSPCILTHRAQWSGIMASSTIDMLTQLYFFYIYLTGLSVYIRLKLNLVKTKRIYLPVKNSPLLDLSITIDTIIANSAHTVWSWCDFRGLFITLHKPLDPADFFSIILGGYKLFGPQNLIDFCTSFSYFKPLLMLLMLY